MPAKSDAQRKFLYATKGEAWVKKHHFDTPGKLPDHVKKKKKTDRHKKLMDLWSK